MPPHCSLNRRGSRSEGRLNLALQERLAESERRKLINERGDGVKAEVIPKLPHIKVVDTVRPKSADTNQQWKMGKNQSILQSKAIVSDHKAVTSNLDTATTTIITDSSTISIPVVSQLPSHCQVMPKYKTMPSPCRINLPNSSPLQLNEIFEEGDTNESVPNTISKQIVSRNQSRTSYEQRRSKFHKNRTASCSSSDASDDDSENRKKRAHKLNTTKPLPPRRDSHDDSSDSQEPGTGAGGGGGNSCIGKSAIARSSTTTEHNTHDTKGNNNNTGGRKNADGSNMMFGKRHKASRRRTGETRLRESQSLNRITEVQEDGVHSLVISTAVTATQGVSMVPKTKSLGARLLQGFNKRNVEDKTIRNDEKSHRMSRKDMKTVEGDDGSTIKENRLVLDRGSTKKLRFLGKYFQVHKRLCIPIPNLFTRNRLYKAQSCGSLVRDKVNLGSDAAVRCRQRAVSVIRNSIGSDGDINQNMGGKNEKSHMKSSTVVQLNNVCNELTGICAVHLGQASKCCSFC